MMLVSSRAICAAGGSGKLHTDVKYHESHSAVLDNAGRVDTAGHKDKHGQAMFDGRQYRRRQPVAIPHQKGRVPPKYP